MNDKLVDTMYLLNVPRGIKKKIVTPEHNVVSFKINFRFICQAIHSFHKCIYLLGRLLVLTLPVLFF